MPRYCRSSASGRSTTRSTSATRPSPTCASSAKLSSNSGAYGGTAGVHMDRTLTSRRTTLQALGGAALGAFGALGSPARAAIGGLPNAAHGDSSPEWDRLRERLFGRKSIEANVDASAVQLIAPLRAAYGAWVPIKIVSKLPQR